MANIKQLTRNALIDVHTHGMGIMLTHILSGHYPYTQDIIDLSKKVKLGGADYAITFPMPTSIYYDVVGIKNRKYRRAGNCDFPFQYENYALVKTVEEFKLDNILPFLSFSTHAKIDEQKKALVDLISSYDIYGLKYHATIERKSVLTKQFIEFADIATEYNIPILVHTKIDQWADPNYIIEFAEANPFIRVCAAHCAHFNTRFFYKIKGDCPINLFVDCSPFTRICYDISRGDKENVMDFDYDNPQVAFLQLFNELQSSLLWGTDTPFNIFSNGNEVSCYANEVKLVNNEALRSHLFENTKRFLFGG